MAEGDELLTSDGKDDASGDNSGQKRIPDIESLHRDLAFANTYRQEFIKSLILIAGGLFAFSVSFRPELRSVLHEELFWVGWVGLAVSMVGGFAQLATWERFYTSYQQYDYQRKDGKPRRKLLTRLRRIALVVQVAGFVVGVSGLGSFTALNLPNVEKSKAAAQMPAPSNNK